MTAPEDGGPLGEEAGGEGVDLRALEARVRRCEERQDRYDKVQAAIVKTLDRDLRFTASELVALLN
jgi:hypothetical protein